MDPDFYDDGTGTLAAVPSGYWTVQPIVFIPGAAQYHRIQYGQRTFATYDEALVYGVEDPEFKYNPTFAAGTVRTYAIVQEGTTDLSTSATFIQAGKFGSTAGTAGGGVATGGAPADASYIVTVADPTLTNEKVIGTDFFITNTHVGTNAGIVESKLALNFATHSNANDPTANEKAALVGTAGAPAADNRYVTDVDARMTDARTPTSHVIITNTGLGAQHTISGGQVGHVFRATGATTATLSQLSHTELSNIGTNTHTQIDAHISSTNNPHSVTANQVLPTQTGHTGKVLTTDGANVSWQLTPQGTVTSVAATGSTGLTVDGSPITSSGTLTLTLDTGLQNLSTLNTTGVLVATGVDTWTTRTVTGTANQIVITNGSGVAGNPTISIASNAVLPGTGAVTVPSGTTAQRPVSPTVGSIRFNTTLGLYEAWDGTTWVSFNAAAAAVYAGTVPKTSGTTTYNISGTPPVTDGTELWSKTITPTSADSSFIINYTAVSGVSTNNRGVVAVVFVNDVFVAGVVEWQDNGKPNTVSITAIHAPGNTSPFTVSVRVGIAGGNGTWYIGSGSTAGTSFGTTNPSWWTIEEVTLRT